MKCIFPFQNLSNNELTELNVNNKLIFPKLSDYKLLDADNCYISTPDFQNLYANNTDFCILHINIRSLNKNFEKLEELLSVLGKMPEIIAISETKLNSNLKTFLPGYTFIHNNSSTNAGGVGMFIKDTLSYKTTIEYQLNIMGCEEIWVKIQLNNTEKVFSVLYRHPNSKLSDFQSSFEKAIENLNKQKLIYRVIHRSVDKYFIPLLTLHYLFRLLLYILE